MSFGLLGLGSVLGISGKGHENGIGTKHPNNGHGNENGDRQGKGDKYALGVCH